MKALWKLLRGNRVAMVGVTILSIFLFIALAAPLITKHAPDKRTGNPHEYPAFVVKAAKA
ncbi:ABC transporter permease, partial [Vibrio fluvialis]|nr:ABC transporter permease [Vibrio fluvialis]